MAPRTLSALIQEVQRRWRQEGREGAHAYLRSTLRPAVDLLLLLSYVAEDPRERWSAVTLARFLREEERTFRALREVWRELGWRPGDATPAGLLAPLIPLATGMTPEAARQVVWPFRGINQPLGKALETGRVTWKDLRWAARELRDPKGRSVRNAARTLLLAALLEDLTWDRQTRPEGDGVRVDAADGPSLAEARGTVWPFRGKARGVAMGEALDRGLLTERDLRWAAEATYGRYAHVGAAARRLLADLNGEEGEGLYTGMTLEEAGRVLWPFKGLNLPMGVALAEGKIGLRDLAWAVEEARDEGLRTAARTLLLAHLTDRRPAAPRRPLKVVEGDAYLEWKERLWWQFHAFFLGMGTMAILLLSVFGVFDFLRNWETLRQLPLSGLVLVGLLFLGVFGFEYHEYRKAVQEARTEAEQFLRGRKGEERAVEILRTLLDDRWTLFRNLTLPNGKGDLDLVLVGPSGVWAFEVKAYRFPTRCEGRDWFYRQGRKWRKLDRNPSRQLIQAAKSLREYLKAQGTPDLWVNAAILWAEEPGKLQRKDPDPPIWTLEELEQQVQGLTPRKKIDPQSVERVRGILEARVEAIKKEEARPQTIGEVILHLVRQKLGIRRRD